MLLIWILCLPKGWEKFRGSDLQTPDSKINPNYTAKVKILISRFLPIYILFKVLDDTFYRYFPSTVLSIASFPFVFIIFLQYLKYLFQTFN